MTRTLLRLTAAVVLWQCAAATADAQLVQVGPGYVKAPFVRVYGYRDGSSYVRAPFVSVFTPGRGGYGYNAGYYGLPGPNDLAQMDWRTLRRAIRDITRSLDRQLATFPAGDHWRTHLRLSELRPLVREADGPPAAEDYGPLEEIRGTFEATKSDLALRDIARLDSFRALTAALGEFVMPPDQRVRRQLSVAATDLDRALERLGPQLGWQKYIGMPVELLASSEEGVPNDAPLNPGVLAEVLARFDSVSRDDQYRVIARLPSFRVTHARLAEYLELLNNPQPVPEELPSPEPQPEQSPEQSSQPQTGEAPAPSPEQ